MNKVTFAIAAVLTLSTATPLLAQGVPGNNASLLGTEGPNSNSVGYPAGDRQLGKLKTTAVGPQTNVSRRAARRTPQHVAPVG